MAKVKVHPYFYENYRKSEFCNICPICGTEGNLSVSFKTEVDIYAYLSLIRGNVFGLRVDQLDPKTTPTIKCHNCDMTLLFALMRGDIEPKDLISFSVQRPFKTIEIIERFDRLFDE
jgi:protein-arginine kinase activator protein McsA